MIEANRVGWVQENQAAAVGTSSANHLNLAIREMRTYLQKLHMHACQTPRSWPSPRQQIPQQRQRTFDLCQRISSHNVWRWGKQKATYRSMILPQRQNPLRKQHHYHNHASANHPPIQPPKKETYLLRKQRARAALPRLRNGRWIRVGGIGRVGGRWVCRWLRGGRLCGGAERREGGE